MPVLELALLQIAQSMQPRDQSLPPDLHSDLTHAMEVLTNASATGLPFHLLGEEEDPTRLYIMGIWPSIAAHEAFLPSAENQDLLARLQGKVSVVWMTHVNVLQFAEGEETTAKMAELVAATAEILQMSSVVGLGRQTVAREHRATFETAWREAEKLQDRKRIAGWRVGRVYGEAGSDEEPADDQFVVLAAGSDVQAGLMFGRLDASQQQGGSSSYVKEVEINHLRRILP